MNPWHVLMNLVDLAEKDGNEEFVENVMKKVKDTEETAQGPNLLDPKYSRVFSFAPKIIFW